MNSEINIKDKYRKIVLDKIQDNEEKLSEISEKLFSKELSEKDKNGLACEWLKLNGFNDGIEWLLKITSEFEDDILKVKKND